MYVVAIVECATPIEVEATALASDLRTTAYEARLLLAPGAPAVVLRTPDKDRALALLAALRGRGHGAVACDAAAVVASTAMSAMRRFRLTGESVLLEDGRGELPFASISTFVAAVHRQHTETTSTVREQKLVLGRAVASGGMMLTKAVKRETTTASDEREPVLYVFHRDEGVPWILREQGTSWTGHGHDVSPVAAENFKRTVQALRERAPAAVYDDRLVTRRASPERLVVAGAAGAQKTTSSTEGGVDLLAHLLGLWFSRSPAPRPRA